MSSQAVAKLDPFEQSLSKSIVSRFSKAKHGDLTWAAEKQHALNIIRANDYMRDQCNPESLAGVMLDVAFTGLSLNPALAHAYIIPYKGTLTFKPSYRGLEHLVYRAGTIKSIQTVIVRKGDFFAVKTKDNRVVVEHEVRNFEDTKANVTHAYAILHYTSGGEYVEVMGRSTLDLVEKQAMSVPRGGAVWKGAWYPEMCRKAVLRRALKHAPMDGAGNMAHAIAVHDKYDPIDFRADPVERDAVEELIGKAEHMELHGYLTTRGIPAKDATDWLVKLAEALGFRKIEELPAKHLDEAKKRLEARYDAWKAKQQ